MKPILWSIYVKDEGGDFVASEHISTEFSKSNRLSLTKHVIPSKYTISIQRFRLLKFSFLPFLYYFHLLIWMRNHKPPNPNFVYTSSPIVALVFQYFPFLPKTKIIRHFHNFEFGEDNTPQREYFISIAKKNLLRFLYLVPFFTCANWIEKTSLLKAWKIIVPTFYSRQIISHRYANIPIHKICIIPNGVDTQIYYPSKVIKTKKTKNIIYVGRFVPEKGIRELLKAFILLDKKTYTLTLISENFDNTLLISMVTDIKNRQSNIRTITNPPPQVIAKEYRKADLCVLASSEKFEQMPLVYIESLRCGTPVVISHLVPGVLPYQTTITDRLIISHIDASSIASCIAWYCKLSMQKKNIIKKKCIAAVSSLSWEKTAKNIEYLMYH